MNRLGKKYTYKSEHLLTVKQVEDDIKKKTKITFEISELTCTGTGQIMPALQKVKIFKLNFTVMHVVSLIMIQSLLLSN